jgi:hypothetical protein
MFKPDKISSNLKLKPLFLIGFSFLSLATCAEDNSWVLQTSVNTASGRYVDSIALKSMQSLGFRFSAEKDQKWGLKMGVQSTDIDMQPFVPQKRQNQDDWMLSGYFHLPAGPIPGRLTFQVDTYRTINDAFQAIGSDVSAWAPKVSWQSSALPLNLDLSYGHSSYKGVNSIRQMSAGLQYGFNGARDWIQIRGYRIEDLTPSSALGKEHLTATDIKYTHIIGNHKSWIPNSLTLGVESGKKIYYIDMVSQSIYNLPMLNEGGKNIALNWKVSPKASMTVQWSKNKYRADQPALHHYDFSVLSTQITKAW